MNARIKHLQKTLERPILIKKKENLLYLTGRSFLHGYLLVKPLPTSPFAKGRRATVTPSISKEGAGGVIFLGDGLERIEGIKSDFLKNVGKYIKPREVLEVFGEFTYAEVKYIKYKNPKLKLKVVIRHDPVDHLRTIKDDREIALVKKSMQIVEQVFRQVRREIIKPGMTEEKLANFIRQAGLKLGANDLSFPPIVAAGANAAVPHHVPSAKKLKAGESIILDFGFKYKGYCSDFTRTVFLKSAPKKLAEAYNQVEKAYWGSFDFINTESQSRVHPKQSYQRARLLRRSSAAHVAPRNFSGASAEAVFQKSVDILAEKNLDKYFIHSLGHGTGLEIHELPNLSPNSRDILQNGMVFSIEPGVYMAGAGGIRIEDLVYLKKGEVQKFIAVSTKLEDNII